MTTTTLSTLEDGKICASGGDCCHPDGPDLPLTEFWLRSSGDYYRQCRSCIKRRRKELAAGAERRVTREHRRSYFYVPSLAKLRKRFYNSRGGARRYNHNQHALTWDELLDLYERQDGKCALTGYVFRCGEAPSIDRIDSSGCYTLDNVQLVHPDVNFAKQQLSQAQFIELCRAVAAHADRGHIDGYQ